MRQTETQGEDSGDAADRREERLAVATARLKKRRDFLAAAKARKWATPGFVLQARDRGDEARSEPARIGFTASKKVGNAVARNRAKRRLRALTQSRAANLMRPGWDYVLIGRAEATASRLFATMEDELAQAIDRVHRPPKPNAKGARPKRSRHDEADAAPSPTVR